MAKNPLCPFEIDGEDFSDCIKLGALRWKKYDVESSKAGRRTDTYMHRLILGKKRQLAVECRRMTDRRARQLAAALDKETVTVRYPDMRLGITTKTFYGTEIEGAVYGVLRDVLCWDNATFTLTEV